MLAIVERLKKLITLKQSNQDSRISARSYKKCATLVFDHGAKRRRRLLAEFLQGRTARQQPNADQETTLQDSEIRDQNQVTLSDDLLFKILILFPADSLFRRQLVCKKWFSLINSSVFIRCHAQQSETVLICKKLTLLEPGNSAALQPVRPQGFEEKLKAYFHFMDLDHGGDSFVESSVVELGDILASCDGLVLATVEKNKSFILMNPVTRKHIVLPLGKKGNFHFESYGIAFSSEAKSYKVVHLFYEGSDCICCEIINICARKWMRIEGPPSDLLIGMGQIPVSVGGSLYWMSKLGCDYIVSMKLQHEKFVSKNLPVRTAMKDRILEIGGNLGFVTHAQPGLLQVWILITGDGSGENWINQYNIILYGEVSYPTPICSSRNGKGMVLGTKADRDLYVYNFDRCEMKLIVSMYGDEEWFRMIDEYIPHRNTLVSWDDHLEVLC